MESPLDGPVFLFIWMCFPLLMCGTLILFFIWGVRSGQFTHQDRARYLPLDSGIPGSRHSSGRKGTADEEEELSRKTN